MHGTDFQKTEEGFLQKLQQTIFLIHKSVINEIPFTIRVMGHCFAFLREFSVHDL